MVKMAERGIDPEVVEMVVNTGKIIKEYPNDEPSPSWLVFGLVEKRPIHVVVARDIATDFCIVITAYEPDIAQWELDFSTKKI